MDPNRRVMNYSNFVVREAERIAVAEENALRFAEQEQRRLAKKAEEYARPPETPLPALPTVGLTCHLHRRHPHLQPRSAVLGPLTSPLPSCKSV